ncbi:hypothetical protein SAMN05421690_102823 [Nitrosomonas sp. Nm51]|uniref:hypothetical protein n=1 Tax=Nitrosomonas sp. Nm51 TaxID=133720 RepID=UPI0008C35ED1|nr:hypothetical protein [Nitrosomonas sp. Nm51]SER46032.1 hypothetical protein SAMN05421690_102823 [Nitrosomonas sp. Nm51]
MGKIDFTVLIKQPEDDRKIAENTPNQAKSRAVPDQFPTDCTKSGNRNNMNKNNNKASARLARLARPKNEGGGIFNDQSPAPEGFAARKLRAANLHPIAVCLLLSVAKKIQCEDEEIFHELIRLETMLPIEQVKTWAKYAVESGIDPYRIIYPFIQSPGKGNDCTGCQHLDMTYAGQPGKSRKVYQWQCKKQHPILEAYHLRERVLIAPVECTDYQKLSTS